MEHGDLVSTASSVIRASTSGPFSADEVALYQRPIPHITRAVRIYRELAVACLMRDSALDGLDRLATATFLVDRRARVLQANRLGDSLLAEGDGLCAPAGVLIALTPDATDALYQAVASACVPPSLHEIETNGVLALPRRSRRPLSALVGPVPGTGIRSHWGVAAAIVFVRDPDYRPQNDNRGSLRRLFGLTAMEARVVTGLVDGKRLEDIAAELRTSYQTVRKQFRSILAKTGTQRQSDVVALVLHSTALMVR